MGYGIHLIIPFLPNTDAFNKLKIMSEVAHMTIEFKKKTKYNRRHTFNNISVISWQSVLLVEIPRENY
jgi:hypothetical protein